MNKKRGQFYMSVTKGKKIIGKRRIIKRKPGKKSKNYFTMDTQQAIVNYQASEDHGDREKIYTKEILPAFDALVENLINVYGYKVMYESKKDLKAECLEFLYGTVEKWDESKGSKAFSYYNVVARHWLTISSKKNVKRMKTYISMESKEEFSSADVEKYEHFNIIPSYEEILRKQEEAKMLKKIVTELKVRVKTDNEKACVDAVDQIVDSLDDIDILNKRAVLLYVREITGLSSKQLSVVLSSLKKHYRELRKTEEFGY